MLHDYAGSSVPAGCTCNAGCSGKAPNSGCGGSCPTAFPTSPLLQRRLTVGAVAHAPRPLKNPSPESCFAKSCKIRTEPLSFRCDLRSQHATQLRPGAVLLISTVERMPSTPALHWQSIVLFSAESTTCKQCVSPFRRPCFRHCCHLLWSIPAPPGGEFTYHQAIAKLTLSEGLPAILLFRIASI